MPNTLTSIFVSNPATEPVEAPHPNTGVYVTGTQATAGGPWTVTHTLVSKTTTPLTMVGRLKNFPTVTVSVVASGGPNAGNIFNSVPLAPIGTSATGTSTGISVTASTSPNGLANRVLASSAAGGPFAQVYQGTASSYPHALAAGTTQYYQYQYVGAGYYDDSPLSAVFSATASAAATVTTLVPILANYGLNGGILRTNGAGQNLHAGLSQLQINLNGATSGTLNVFSTGGSANVLAYDGTTLLGEKTAGANSLTGLSGGTLTLYMGGQQRSYEQGDVQGADVSSFVFPAGIAGSFIAPVQATRAVAVFGDSISNGATLAVPQRDGFTALIRSARNSSTVLGYGSGTAGVMFDPANYATLLKPRLQAIWAGATEQAGLLLIGTNDYGGSGGGAAVNGGLSAADLQTRLTTAFTNITTDFPAAKLLLVTPLYRSDEASTNSYGLTLPAYRTAETAAASGFAAITSRDGSVLLATATDYAADGVHPNAAGHQKIFNFVATALNSLFTPVSNNVAWANLRGTTVTASAAGGVRLTATTNAGAISWTNGGSSKSAIGAVASSTTELGRLTFPNVVIGASGSSGWVAGLTDTANASGTLYTAIRYAFYRDNGVLRVFQSGSSVFQMTFPAGTPTLAIVIFPTYISYTVNGAEVFRNTSAPVFPLFAEADFNSGTDPGCYVENVTLTAQNLVLSPYQA